MSPCLVVLVRNGQEGMLKIRLSSVRGGGGNQTGLLGWIQSVWLGGRTILTDWAGMLVVAGFETFIQAFGVCEPVLRWQRKGDFCQLGCHPKDLDQQSLIPLILNADLLILQQTTVKPCLASHEHVLKILYRRFHPPVCHKRRRMVWEPLAGRWFWPCGRNLHFFTLRCPSPTVSTTGCDGVCDGLTALLPIY